MWNQCTHRQYPHVALGLADISLRSLDESGKAFTAIWGHTLAIPTVRSTDGLATQLLGTTIAGQAVTTIRRNALLVRATCSRTMRSAKETSLRIQSVARMTSAGAVQVASSMLAGDGACVNTCAQLVAHELREALAISRLAAEAIATIIRRTMSTIRHTVARIRIGAIALAALLYAMKVYGRSIAPHRRILVGLKENGTGERERERINIEESQKRFRQILNLFYYYLRKILCFKL